MIRIRLLVGFVVIALLPLIGVSIGTYIVNYRSGRQQSIDRLESVAARKELAIQGWIESLRDELVSVIQADYAPGLIWNALRLANEDEIYPWYINLVRKRLQAFLTQSTQFDELFLLDLHGRVLVSTAPAPPAGPAREGEDYRNQELFIRGLQGAVTLLPFPQGNLAAGDQELPLLYGDSVFSVIPVDDMDQQRLGVLVGRGKLDALHAILEERTGLGETGKAYLVNNQGVLLNGTRAFAARGASISEVVAAAGVSEALAKSASVSGLYKDPLGVNVIGVYRWVADPGVVLAVEQDASETFRVMIAALGINLVIAITAIVLAVFASLWLTRSIANPIIELAETASQIAKGDFERTANVERNDEVGVLGRAFNSMTVQLRDLINTLERRVAERTQDLQAANEALRQRALQMETSAQVGREITSILNLDVLLRRVVELIQDAFGYYHVQVFLLDRDAQQLVLRAHSGDVFSQYQRIALEQTSINSQSVLLGKPIMVNDVSQDTNFLYDEKLPETRAELVIPLRLGEQIIGTLDVHASQVDAFSEQDVRVLQGLGDQIVVAIENARLYDQSRELAVLEERTRLARELHDSVTQSLYSLVLLTEGWRRQVSAGGSAEAEDYLSKIGAIAQSSLKEMRMLIHELRPPTLQQEGLVGALQKRLDVVESKVGIEARVVMEDFIEMPPEIEDGLYWIALEALNNAMKHAQAKRVTIRISAVNDSVVLEVTDDGVGFDPLAARQSGGMGLNNMQERARQLGGTCAISSAPGEGTLVTVTVPLLRVGAGSTIK